MSTETKQLDWHFKIPHVRLGRRLPEERIKRGLVELNEDIFFDVASRLNLTTPYMDYYQGVYYDKWPDGKKYVCPMDRGGPLQGMLSEVPVWSTMIDMVEVKWNQLKPQEIVNPEFGALMPAMRQPCECEEAPCEHDRVLVKRPVKDELILFGWRSVFITLSKANIPGITISSLESKFGISLAMSPQEVELLDNATPPWMEDGPDEDEVWDDMGLFEKTPTAGPWEGTK